MSKESLVLFSKYLSPYCCCLFSNTAEITHIPVCLIITYVFSSFCKLRITALLSLEGIFGEHLVKTPCSKQGQLEQAGQGHVQSSLSISKDGGSTISLGILFQNFTAQTAKMFSYI